MSGHSKWANIKHRKSQVDEKRGKLFTRLGRELIMAAKEGGGDSAVNSRLRLAIQKAREANMPNDNIQRAIQRGTGEVGGADYEETIYEGYGPGGVAITLEITTDNRNRTAGEIRYLFSRNGGSMGETGCVSWMFDLKGIITVDAPGDLDEFMLTAIEAGAEDVSDEDGSVVIITEPGQLEEIKQALADKGYKKLEAEISRVPQNTVALEDPGQQEQLGKLLDLLENHDDVQAVYSNYEFPE